MFGLRRHCGTGEEERPPRAAHTPSALAAIAPADLPPTERSTPQYGDLVNVDFPSEQEYKHHTSNWANYRRKDFNDRVRALERFHLSLASLSPLRRFVLLLSIGGFVLNVTGLLGAFNPGWSLDRLMEFFSRWMIQNLLIPEAAANVFVTIVNLLFSTLFLIDPLIKFLSPSPSTFKNIEDGPVLEIDLIAKTGGKPVRAIYTFFREWLFYLGLLLGLRALLRRLGIRRIEWRVLPYLTWDELIGRRTVWLGNGQVQFGCGAKGISIEHHGGYLYLAQWDKVDAIYDAPTKEGDAFDFQIYLSEHAPKTSSQLPARALPGPRETGVGRALPLHGHKAPPGDKFASNASQLRGEARKLGWAKNSIRIRLYGTNKDDPPDEIVIPFRFFGDQPGELTWKEFMEHCLTYKFYPEHADGAGKSVGQIETGRPAQH